LAEVGGFLAFFVSFSQMNTTSKLYVMATSAAETRQMMLAWNKSLTLPEVLNEKVF